MSLQVSVSEFSRLIRYKTINIPHIFLLFTVFLVALKKHGIDHQIKHTKKPKIANEARIHDTLSYSQNPTYDCANLQGSQHGYRERWNTKIQPFFYGKRLLHFKEELKERVMEFLMKPKASGRKAPEPNQPSKKSKTQKSDKGKKRKRTPKKPKEGKDDSEEEEDNNDDNDGDIEGDEEADEPPKKKKKAESKPKSAEKSKSSKSKTPAKKETKKESKKSPKKSKPVTVKITSGKKTPKKSPKKAHKTVEDLSSDEEPLVKKLKKQPPTNDDLVTLVKDLLKDADLKVVTVKSICKEVYAKYPEFDLSDRKGFIKETVYSVISSDSDQ